ncbi:unnamed protein product [Parajaminaea phylloscopi]
MAWSPTALLLGLQFGTRLFTFVLNQALIRVSTPSTYGAAHIHLELLLGIVLFLSREGIRAASLRQPDETTTNVKEAKGFKTPRSNLPLIPIPVGIALASLALPIFLRSSPDLAERPHFVEVVCLYLLSSLLELIAEPVYLHALSPDGGRDIALRVRAEGFAAIAKGLLTLASVYLLPDDCGLLAFGIGQATYGLTILSTFLVTYALRYGIASTARLYVPRLFSAASTQSKATSALAVSLSVQSFFKHILTEADKVAVSHLATLEDQGGYALGTNYASLPLRLLFQPLEESSRFQFSTNAGSTSAQAQTQSSGKQHGMADAQAARRQSLDLLRSLLHLHAVLGAFLLAYLPPLARPFILIASGQQWVSTSAPRTLAAYAVFLPVLGWSGILEGFLQSTASQAQLKRYNYVILASSISFGGSLWVLNGRRIPSVAVSTEEALVYSSAIAMAVRAIWGWRYARSCFSELSVGSLGPSWPTLGLMTLGAAYSRATVGPLVLDSIGSYTLPVARATGTAVLALASTAILDRKPLLNALRRVRGSGNQ